MNDTCLAEDSVSDISVQNGKEYLARLGIDTRGPPLTLANISHGASYQTLEGGDITSMVYSRLTEDARSDKNSMVSGGNNSVYARTGHPVSITGSLSSIVHSEEELAGSYNWDYLLDWGPQYQPLAHVFQEISSLKDEGSSGAGGEARAPPIITCRPPRHVQHSHPSHAGGLQQGPRSLTQALQLKQPCRRLFPRRYHLLPLGLHLYHRLGSRWETEVSSQGALSAILQGEEDIISLPVPPTMEG